MLTMRKFVKSSFWSDLLKVGCVPQKNLISKHFQQFLNQTVSNYQGKRDRRVESIRFESKSSNSPAEKVSHLEKRMS